MAASFLAGFDAGAPSRPGRLGVEVGDDEFAAEVESLRNAVAGGRLATPAPFREIAQVSLHLPVYCDMGGCLVLSPRGLWFVWNTEVGRLEPLTDPLWTTLDKVSTAEQYPSLAMLRPRRSAGAK